MYFAKYCLLDEYPEFGLGWRITDMDDSLTLVNDDDTDIKFARRIDCELACKSLNEAASAGEDILETSDERFGFLLTRYLQW